MADELKKGDTGTVLTFTVQSDGSVVDLSTADTKQVKFDRPYANGKFSKDLAFVTDGTDGKVKYVIEPAILDTAGEWHFQLYFSFSTGVWYSDTQSFLVGENL